MTIFPNPFFGRSSYAKFRPRYVAFARDLVTNIVGPGLVSEWKPRFRISINARQWSNGLLSGDINDALRTDGPLGRAFRPAKVIAFKGKLILVGALGAFDSSGGYQSRAAIYISENGYKFGRATLSNDNLHPTASGIVDVAANDDWLVALGQNGVLHYWNGVGAWQSRTDLPVGPSPATSRNMTSIAATASGFVVAGAVTNSGGGPGASIVLSSPAPNVAFISRSIPSILQPYVSGKGNVVLFGSYSDPSGSTPRIIYSGLNDLSNWASAGFQNTQAIVSLMHNGAKWVGGSGYNKFLAKSALGTSGWAVEADPAKTPWGNVPQDHPFINSGIADEGKFIVHWGHYGGPTESGGVSVSNDGDNWDRYSHAAAGLEPYPMIIGAFPP